MVGRPTAVWAMRCRRSIRRLARTRCRKWTQKCRWTRPSRTWLPMMQPKLMRPSRRLRVLDGGAEAIADSAIATSPDAWQMGSGTDPRWNDWHWQLRNRLETLEELETVVTLTDDERRAMQ